MTAYELHSLLASNRDLIADTWNIFLGIHVGIIAALTVRTGPMIGRRIFLATPFYFGFLYMNFRAQQDNYRYATAVIQDLRQVELNQPSTVSLTSRVFEAGWVTQYLPIIYLAVAAFVAALTAIAALSQVNPKSNALKRPAEA